MSKRKILIQLDTDQHPSVFDRVVAVDAGAEELFSYGGVRPADVEALVHGAIFTRGPAELKSTAIFVGGRNVVHAEELLASVRRAFFGPMRCSVLLDPNGANTTAAAAVLAANRHLDLKRTKALVLGGTGPVGQRAALLLARQGAAVWLSSRSLERANDACSQVKLRVPDGNVFPASLEENDSIAHHAERFQLVVAAGAAGARLLNRSQIQASQEIRLLIDLNAVPPSGIEGVEVTDKGREVEGILQYGALGVGGTKMKIHKAAIARLFEQNDLVLDAEEIFDLGLQLG